jgi:hypothetical protein
MADKSSRSKLIGGLKVRFGSDFQTLATIKNTETGDVTRIRWGADTNMTRLIGVKRRE